MRPCRDIFSYATKQPFYLSPRPSSSRSILLQLPGRNTTYLRSTTTNNLPPASPVPVSPSVRYRGPCLSSTGNELATYQMGQLGTTPPVNALCVRPGVGGLLPVRWAVGGHSLCTDSLTMHPADAADESQTQTRLQIAGRVPRSMCNKPGIVSFSPCRTIQDIQVRRALGVSL